MGPVLASWSCPAGDPGYCVPPSICPCPSIHHLCVRDRGREWRVGVQAGPVLSRPWDLQVKGSKQVNRSSAPVSKACASKHSGWAHRAQK